MVDSIVVGLEAVAEYFGKSLRQVQRWQAEGMPRLSQRRYDVLQIQEWLEKKRGVVRPGPKSSYQDPKQLTFMDQTGELDHDGRLRKAKADKAEMEVKQLRRELVKLKEIEQLFVGRILAVKQGLLTLQRSLPPQLIHCREEREMAIIIADAVREFLLAFSRPLPDALGGLAIDLDDFEEDGEK